MPQRKKIDKLNNLNKEKLKAIQIKKVQLNDLKIRNTKKVYERKLILHNGKEVIQHVRIQNTSARIALIEKGFKIGGALMSKKSVERINLDLLGKKGEIVELEFVGIPDDSGRNRGLGAQMITEAMHIAKKEFGQKELYLRSVLDKIEFYEKLGFKKVKNKKRQDLMVGSLPVMKIKL